MVIKPGGVSVAFVIVGVGCFVRVGSFVGTLAGALVGAFSGEVTVAGVASEPGGLAVGESVPVGSAELSCGEFSARLAGSSHAIDGDVWYAQSPSRLAIRTTPAAKDKYFLLFER